MNGDNNFCPELVEGRVAADRHAIHNVIEATNLFSERVKLSKRDAVHLRIVVEELFTNILKHGRLPPSSFVEYRLERRGNLANIEISDQGIPFDPRQDLPDKPNSDHGGEGGQGWPLIMSWCRIAGYRNASGRNQLHLVLPLEDVARQNC
ncbi:MAG: ATP-binding protein [Pseudomonadota bacterium]